MAAGLRVSYNLDVAQIEFVPKGETSFCYFLTNSDGRKYFLKALPEDRGNELEAVYEALGVLQRDCRLTEVVGPYKTSDGSHVLRLGGYAVGLFPLVGEQSLWDKSREDISQDVLRQIGSFLARLHACPAVDAGSLFRETFANQFTLAISRAIEAARFAAVSGATIQQEVKGLLLRHESEIQALLLKMETMRRKLSALDLAMVTTHGDPNLANIIIADSALHVVDWDDIGLRPPEADLWTVTSAGLYDLLLAYTEAGGSRKLRAEVFEFYEYRWTVQEIADYATRILFRDQTAEEDKHAWEELQPYLPVPFEKVEEGIEHQRRVLQALGLS